MDPFVPPSRASGSKSVVFVVIGYIVMGLGLLLAAYNLIDGYGDGFRNPSTIGGIAAAAGGLAVASVGHLMKQLESLALGGQGGSPVMGSPAAPVMQAPSSGLPPPPAPAPSFTPASAPPSPAPPAPSPVAAPPIGQADVGVPARAVRPIEEMSDDEQQEALDDGRTIIVGSGTPLGVAQPSIFSPAVPAEEVERADDGPEPGWYPDPKGSGARYWDGNGWTDRTDER